MRARPRALSRGVSRGGHWIARAFGRVPSVCFLCIYLRLHNPLVYSKRARGPAALVSRAFMGTGYLIMGEPTAVSSATRACGTFWSTFSFGMRATRAFGACTHTDGMRATPISIARHSTRLSRNSRNGRRMLPMLHQHMVSFVVCRLHGERAFNKTAPTVPACLY